MTRGQPLEEGTPVGNTDAFRRCLGQFATGVTIITASSAGRLAGLTSNSFSSLSMDPPLVVWAIRRQSRSLEIFRAAPCFAVNILAVDQLELARSFARSADDKFRFGSWTEGLGSSPVLDGVVASFECAKTATVDGGDHVMLIGRVERYRRYDRPPLLFAQGRFTRLTEPPDGDTGVLEKLRLPSEPSRELTTSLMFKAYRAMLRLFEQARTQEGLSYPEVVFLNAIRARPGNRLEALVSNSAFDLDSSRALASGLVARRLLIVDGQGHCHVTEEGTRLIERIVQRTSEMREAVFANLPAEDVSAALRVVNEIVAQGVRAEAGNA